MLNPVRAFRTVLCGLVVLAAALPASAGDVTFPSTVQANYRGEYSVTILVTGTTDPMFQILQRDNVAESSFQQLHTGPRSFQIEIRGLLINLQRGGSFSFRADPEGTFVHGTVHVAPPALAGVFDLHGNLVIDQRLLKGLITCEFKCSDGKSYTMFCGANDTPEECCAVVRKAGCPAPSQFVSGDCDGKSCAAGKHH
jgi:hypothetical protein